MPTPIPTRWHRYSKPRESTREADLAWHRIARTLCPSVLFRVSWSIGGETLQIDCGGRSYSRLLEAGRLPEDVDLLFLSHLHSDHMMDFGALSHARWDLRAASLKVRGPAPIGRISEQLFGATGIFRNDMDARVNHGPSRESWKVGWGTIPRPGPAFDLFEVTPGIAREGKGWGLHTCLTIGQTVVAVLFCWYNVRESADNALSPDTLHGSDHMIHEARALSETRRVRTVTCTASVNAATHCRLDAFLRQQTTLWNAAIEERIDCYRKTGKTITAFDQMKSLTVIRGEDEDFRQFNVGPQRSVLRRLDKSFKSFSRRARAGETPGFPRFKGRSRGIRSFDIPDPVVGSHIDRT